MYTKRKNYFKKNVKFAMEPGHNNDKKPVDYSTALPQSSPNISTDHQLQPPATSSPDHLLPKETNRNTKEAYNLSTPNSAKNELIVVFAVLIALFMGGFFILNNWSNRFSSIISNLEKKKPRQDERQISSTTKDQLNYEISLPENWESSARDYYQSANNKTSLVIYNEPRQEDFENYNPLKKYSSVSVFEYIYSDPEYDYVENSDQFFKAKKDAYQELLSSGQDIYLRELVSAEPVTINGLKAHRFIYKEKIKNNLNDTGWDFKYDYHVYINQNRYFVIEVNTHEQETEFINQIDKIISTFKFKG